MTHIPRVLTLFALCAAAPPILGQAVSRDTLITFEHYVLVNSNVPAIRGQRAPLYLRERLRSADAAALPERAPIVLLVHGSTVSSEPAFDPPYSDYNWMDHLARAGFDVFAVDLAGYGRSVRPFPMHDACNLPPERQSVLIPAVLSEPCEASWPGPLTSFESDWADLNQVVDYIRTLRRTERIDLVGWSLGGARVGGYAARYPDKVGRLVLLAPFYGRDLPDTPPPSAPPLPSLRVTTEAEFASGWTSQVKCPGTVDPVVQQGIWRAILRADPVGATWGAGINRAPIVARYGWNQRAARSVLAPVLLLIGEHDQEVLPARVRELYEDLGSTRKVLVELTCATHSAPWEAAHVQLFRLSAEWLTRGSADGVTSGMLRVGSR